MRFLIIVQPERFDFYNYLSSLGDHDFILLWYADPKQMNYSLEDLPISFSKMIYWSDFRTPNQLINAIQPDKIIFFEIVDLRQIALLVAANHKKISTFYLEHGAAGNRQTAIKRWEERNFKDHFGPYLLKRLKNNFSDIIKSKIFYFSVTKGFKSLRSYVMYLKLPLLMLGQLGNKVLANNKFKERVPKYSIVFNRINFDQFELYTGVGKADALLTGIPHFDKFYSNENVEENYIVFIDHPYLEEGILGWTPEHHQTIAEELIAFAEKNRIKVYIKLHPISSKENWEKYACHSNYIEIIQFGDFTSLYLRSKLILGFSSSLITGFLCAKKNVVLLGWHPSPHIFGVDFSEYGICHVSFSPGDLKDKYSIWINDNKCHNRHEYEVFLEECNYPFDGKATERVIHAIKVL